MIRPCQWVVSIITSRFVISTALAPRSQSDTTRTLTRKSVPLSTETSIVISVDRQRCLDLWNTSNGFWSSFYYMRGADNRSIFKRSRLSTQSTFAYSASEAESLLWSCYPLLLTPLLTETLFGVADASFTASCSFECEFMVRKYQSCDSCINLCETRM